MCITWARRSVAAFSYRVLLRLSESTFLFDHVEFENFMTTLPPSDQVAVQVAVETLLPNYSDLGSRWITALPDGLLQLRIGPTQKHVLRRADIENAHSPKNQRILLRLYFAEQSGRITVLSCYNKAADPSRATQQHFIALATSRMKLIEAGG